MEETVNGYCYRRKCNMPVTVALKITLTVFIDHSIGIFLFLECCKHVFVSLLLAAGFQGRWVLGFKNLFICWLNTGSFGINL